MESSWTDKQCCCLPLESFLSVLMVTHLQKHIVGLWGVQISTYACPEGWENVETTV